MESLYMLLATSATLRPCLVVGDVHYNTNWSKNDYLRKFLCYIYLYLYVYTTYCTSFELLNLKTKEQREPLIEPIGYFKMLGFVATVASRGY
jgi:hypothetical protein